MNGNNSLRRQFAQPQPEEEDASEELEPLPPEMGDYEPFATIARGKRGDGLMLYFDEEMIEIIFYNYLMRVICFGNDFIALVTIDSVYNITGQNLRPLLPLLREHKVRFIQTHNERRHPPLNGDPSQTVIGSITIMTNEQFFGQFNQRGEIRDLGQ